MSAALDAGGPALNAVEGPALSSVEGQPFGERGRAVGVARDHAPGRARIDLPRAGEHDLPEIGGHRVERTEDGVPEVGCREDAGVARVARRERRLPGKQRREHRRVHVLPGGDEESTPAVEEGAQRVSGAAIQAVRRQDHDDRLVAHPGRRQGGEGAAGHNVNVEVRPFFRLSLQGAGQIEPRRRGRSPADNHDARQRAGLREADALVVRDVAVRIVDGPFSV